MATNHYADFGTMTFPADWGMNFTKTIHRKPSASIEPANVTLRPGYTVVITGAGKGIGEHIAKAYVEAQAQNFILTSRTESDLERVKLELEEIAAKQNRKIDVAICPGDVTDPQSYTAIARVLKDRYNGRLDCLITNAGGGEMTKADLPLHEGDLDVFTRATELNYMAPYFGMMALIPFLLNTPGTGKTIINIVSGAAHITTMPPPSYNVAKLATVRMTEIIATSYAEQGLQVFAVHPGGVVTTQTIKQIPGSLALLTEDIRLCGAVCVWLSKEEPAWASGRYISSTWDMDEFKAMEQEIVAGNKLKFRMVV